MTVAISRGLLNTYRMAANIGTAPLTTHQDPRPPDPLDQPPFSGITTFGRLRHTTAIDDETIDLAILGIPFDGLVTFRPGARFGPGAIRQSSVLCRNYSQQMERSEE